MNDTPRFLRRKEAAAYIREHHGQPCTASTLAKLAVVGGGPAFRKMSRIPLYEPVCLDAWAEARLSPRYTSTSEMRARAA